MKAFYTLLILLIPFVGFGQENLSQFNGIEIDKNDTLICLGNSISLEANYLTNNQSIFNSSVILPSPIINDEAEFTITAIVKANEFESENTSYIYKQIIGGEVCLKIENGNIWFQCKASYGNCFTSGGWVYLNSPILDDDWHIYTGVYNRNEGILELYVDGTLMASSFINNGSLANCDLYDAEIGQTNNNIFIDEIAIFNFAQDLTEIQSFECNSISGNENGLIAYWNFNEGYGTEVQEINGNFNGVLSGSYSIENSCSSFSTQNNLLWSTGDSSNSINVSPTQTTTYYATIIDSEQIFTDSVTIEVLNIHSVLDTSTCLSFEWNGTTYTQSGTYSYNGGGSNNYSMDFDGIDDEIIVTSSPAFSSNFTIQAWWYKAIGSTSNAFWTIGDSFLPDGLELYVGGGGTETKVYSAGGPVILANSNPSPGEWHHYAVVRESGVVKLYIDGVQDPNTWNSNITFNGDLTIGQEIYSGGQATVPMWCDGYIDNFEIWDIALSQQEIQQYMTCPPTENESGLVGYWNFEEGEGNTVYDLSGNGNDGTINGATYSTYVPEQSCQLTTVNGCDSVAILNLTINQPDTSFTEVTACESYEWNGETYTVSGTYECSEQNDNEFSMSFDGDNEYVNCGNGIDISNKSFTLSACVKKDGADFTGASIVMTTGNGTINNGLYFGFNYQDGQDYLFLDFYGNGICYSTLPVNIEGDGEWYHIAATYNLLTNERILYLDGIIVGSDISQSAFMSSNTDFCIGITSWNLVDDFNGKIDDACVWDRVLTQSEIQNYVNCHPTSNEEGLVGYWNFEEGEGNIAYDLSGNGNDGTINGASFSTDVPEQSCQLTTVSGCDSVAVLNLTITQPDTSFTEVTACESYEWNGETYTESGVYSNIYTNANGCDSTHTLNLTINSTTFGTDTQVHCDTYTWIDGITYTESNNTAIFSLTNSNSCDSIVTLDLIINNSDNTSSSVTACDEFTWDGQTYSESGEYTNTYTNANGCDSTHTLNLIINNSISSNTEASSCSSYEWNGLIYENSGTYEFDTIASNGCDSTAILELEICYLDQLEINGPTAAVTSTTSSFSVQDNTGSAFIWSIEGLGTISSGQYTNEIFIDWSEIEGITTICVYEKYDCSGLECLGDTICLEVEIKSPTSIVENNLDVNIYPNPSLNIFNLEFNSDSETEILVTNVLGEQVYFESTKSNGEFNTQIDLSDYSKSIYNLTIKTSDGLSNHKLILQ